MLSLLCPVAIYQRLLVGGRMGCIRLFHLSTFYYPILRITDISIYCLAFIEQRDSFLEIRTRMIIEECNIPFLRPMSIDYESTDRGTFKKINLKILLFSHSDLLSTLQLGAWVAYLWILGKEYSPTPFLNLKLIFQTVPFLLQS